MRTTGQLGVFAVVLLWAGPMPAQTGTSDKADASAGPDAKEWEFSLILDGYAVPHRQFYVSPTFTADRGWLHLETRYNYENQKTGSVWFGYNFRAGRTLELRVTPMVAGVFGRTAGIAPGCLLSLTYKRLAFSSASEYVFDMKNPSSNFFYSWPQLTYSPRDWIRFGLVAQRTKAYQTSLDVQRGVFAGFSVKKLSFTTYVFNAGWTDPTVVIEAGYSF